MRDNWHNAFEHVIASEGGYVRDQHDRGGETNLGVTRKAWEAYIGRPVEEGEMRALTTEAVQPFYKEMYWDRVRGDDLPDGVDYAVFDFAVNAGPGRAAKFLQEAAGVHADGVIGPATLAAVKHADPEELLKAFGHAKSAFYRRLADRDASQLRFLKGWLNRVAEVERTASSMIS